MKTAHLSKPLVGPLYDRQYDSQYDYQPHRKDEGRYDLMYQNLCENPCEEPCEKPSIPSIRLDKDVVPVSQFKANVALLVQQVRETGRPMLITQRGRGIVVLLDVREFEAMRERLGSLDSVGEGPR